MNKKDNVQEIEDHFEDNDFSVTDISEYDGRIVISIEWGDWKHDHGYCDYLMEQLGYKLDYEQETETDGSDCYSSIHVYVKKAA